MEIRKNIIEWIFPEECIICSEEGSWLCSDCLVNIDFKPSNVCEFCGKFSFLGLTCKKCKNENYLDGIFSYNSYKNIALKKIIHHYKYNYIEKLGENLAFMLGVIIKNIEKGQVVGGLKNIINNDTIYFSVPLHEKRLRERGFDQSKLLLDKLVNQNLVNKENVGVGLLRIKYTSAQAKIKNENERSKNLTDAFKYCGDDLKNKNIILIDDVYTTGATLRECAKELKKFGARRVYGAVIAKR